MMADSAGGVAKKAGLSMEQVARDPAFLQFLSHQA
jgi:hypothetical protein